jgi:hypothetical protein
VVIGRKGAEIDKLKEELSRMTGKEIYVAIIEIKTPETDAQLVAENVALQLERRVSFRRAMKKALQTAKDFGAEGIKIRCAGRGAELARVGNITGAAFRCTRCARRSIMVLPRPTPCTENLESSAGCAKAKPRHQNLSRRCNRRPSRSPVQIE